MTATQQLNSGTRVPPQNLDAERSVLGGILLDNAALRDVAQHLEPPDFYREAHRYVYAAMVAISNRHEPIDRVTVKDQLTRQGLFAAVGGDDFVDLLDKVVPSASNLAYYARIVAQKAQARRVIEAATAIAIDGYEQQDDEQEGDFLARARARLQGLERRSGGVLKKHKVQLSAASFRERPPPREYLFIDANTGAGRMVKGSVGLFAASGGSGKTWALKQLTLSVATGAPWFGSGSWSPTGRGRVFYLNGEEPKDECLRRLYYAARAMEIFADADIDAIIKRVTVLSMVGSTDTLIVQDPKTGLVLPTAMCLEVEQALIEALQAGDPYTAFIADPLARFAAIDTEKDSNSATAFMKTIERLCFSGGGVTGIVAHHNRKRPAASTEPSGVDDIRGAGALKDAARWAMMLEQQEQKEGQADLITLRIVKANGTPPMFGPLVLVRDAVNEGALRIANAGEIDSHERVSNMVRSTLQKIGGHSDRILEVMKHGQAGEIWSSNRLVQSCGKRSLTLAAIASLVEAGKIERVGKGPRDPQGGVRLFGELVPTGTGAGTSSGKSEVGAGTGTPGRSEGPGDLVPVPARDLEQLVLDGAGTASRVPVQAAAGGVS